MASTDESDDGDGFVPPLPPDDRLWRHPSEMATTNRTGPSAAPQTRADDAGRTNDGGRRRQRQTLVLSAVAGVVVAVGVLAAVGTFQSDEPSVAVEQVAIEPPQEPAILDRLGPALARLDTGLDTGRDTDATATTAIVYRSDGYLLVAADAVAAAAALTITLDDGRVLPATLVGSDRISGVAVVKVEATGLVAAVMDGQDVPETGDDAVAVSRATDQSLDPLVARAQVTGTGWRVDGTTATRHDLIRATLESDQPSPSGVLCSPSGTVLAMILPDQDGTARPRPTASVSATSTTVLTTTIGGSSPSHFATPISLAIRVADEILATGRPHYAWLGVQGDDLDPSLAAVLGHAGALLGAVDAGGPAEAGGLRTGDVITAVDDQPVRSISELVIALRQRNPGDEVSLTYRRGGDEGLAAVTLADSPG